MMGHLVTHHTSHGITITRKNIEQARVNSDQIDIACKGVHVVFRDAYHAPGAGIQLIGAGQTINDSIQEIIGFRLVLLGLFEERGIAGGTTPRALGHRRLRWAGGECWQGNGHQRQ